MTSFIKILIDCAIRFIPWKMRGCTRLAVDIEISTVKMTSGFLLLANRLYYGENEIFIQLFLLPMRLTGERAL